jgi:hypothetical protein
MFDAQVRQTYGPVQLGVLLHHTLGSGVERVTSTVKPSHLPSTSSRRISSSERDIVSVAMIAPSRRQRLPGLRASAAGCNVIFE